MKFVFINLISADSLYCDRYNKKGNWLMNLLLRCYLLFSLVCSVAWAQPVVMQHGPVAVQVNVMIESIEAVDAVKVH